MTAAIKNKVSSKQINEHPSVKKTDTQTSVIITDTPKKHTEVNEQGKIVLKKVQPLEPIIPSQLFENAKSTASRDANSRVDDVLDIAKRVAEAKPMNFDLVFEMAMKVYIMSTFRSSNNMAIEISA